MVTTFITLHSHSTIALNDINYMALVLYLLTTFHMCTTGFPVELYLNINRHQLYSTGFPVELYLPVESAGIPLVFHWYYIY